MHLAKSTKNYEMGSEGSRTQAIYSPMPPGFLHRTGMQKNVRANLECVQTHSSEWQLMVEAAWPLWSDCTETGRQK